MERTSKSNRWYLALVLAAAMYASIGIWNAGIPLGDEGVHVLQALKILEGMPSTNLYYMAYAAIFRFITDDPVVAHLVLRFLATVSSTLGLYLVLRSFRSISPLAVLITCFAWVGSSLNSPFTQSGNINLFSLSLVLPGLAYLLRAPSLSSLMVFALSALWAASVRPEYLASLILVTTGGLFLLYFRRNMNLSVPKKSAAHAIRIGLLVVALAGSALAIFSRSGGPPFDGYLLQGLGQCYSVDYKRRHPEAQFDPMTEYQLVLDKVFGNPRTFTEALSNNPAEATSYFIRNGARNLLRVVPNLLAGSQAIQNVLVKLLLLLGLILGFHKLYRRQKEGNNLKSPSQEDVDKFLLLLLFASASFVSILLLIPDARYWISWVPLVYLLFAWVIDQVLDKFKLQRRSNAVLLVCFTILSSPVFFAKHSNQPLIYSLRESMSGLQREPVVAGNFVFGLVTFTFSGKATQINTYNDLSPDGLRNRTYDVFVADGLDGTALWGKNREFFEAFVSKPEAYGYRLFPEGLPAGMRVYVRNK